MASSLPNPRRLLVSNQAYSKAQDQAEPGVEVIVDSLEPIAVMPQFMKAPIATHTAIPTSNQEAYVLPDLPKRRAHVRTCNQVADTYHGRSGRPRLDTVPGSGIVMPGGASIYYLDLAPNSDSPMVRAYQITASKTAG